MPVQYFQDMTALHFTIQYNHIDAVKCENNICEKLRNIEILNLLVAATPNAV